MHHDVLHHLPFGTTTGTHKIAVTDDDPTYGCSTGQLNVQSTQLQLNPTSKSSAVFKLHCRYIQLR
jgi:hypothetical protein